jgi:hypothetical protein
MRFGKNVEDAFGHLHCLSFYIAGLAVFDYIEGFYNPHRRHSRLQRDCGWVVAARRHPLPLRSELARQ